MFLPLPTLVEVEFPRYMQTGEDQAPSSPMYKTRAISAFNSAYQELTRIGIANSHPNLLAYYNAQMEDSTTGYLQEPIPFRASQIVAVSGRASEYPTNTEWNAVMAWRGAGRGGGSSRGGVQWERAGQNRIRIMQSGSVPPFGFRVWFLASPPSLHYGIVGSSQTTSNTQLWLNKTPTVGKYDFAQDVYNNSPIYIYEGPGVGQFAKIISVLPTGEATCENYNDPTLDAFPTAIGATSKYCILPWFSDTHFTLLVLKAMSYYKKYDAASMLGAEMARALEYFEMESVTASQSASKPLFAQGVGSDYGMGMGSGFYGGSSLTFY